MGRFLSDLDVKEIDDKRWMLDEPFFYQSDTLKTVIEIPKGFETDFASVPRLPLIFWLCGDVAHKPAVIHDWIYRKGLYTRPLADETFLEAMEDDNVSFWRRKLMYWGVRIGGASSYKGKPEPEVIFPESKSNV